MVKLAGRVRGMSGAITISSASLPQQWNSHRWSINTAGAASTWLSDIISNAHATEWGSSDTNQEERACYSFHFPITIHPKCREQTHFNNRIRKKVIATDWTSFAVNLSDRLRRLDKISSCADEIRQRQNFRMPCWTVTVEVVQSIPEVPGPEGCDGDSKVLKPKEVT